MDRMRGSICLFVFSLFAALGAQAGEPITLDARLAQPVMKDGEAQKNYLRVALSGCQPEPTQNRTPVNVAFVIDRSGSMQGPRIAQAREAAIMAVNRLRPNDIASVVIFDQTRRRAGAGAAGRRPRPFTDRIRQIGARRLAPPSTTACCKARAEVAKFKDARRLNRVVLLSDGQANVGPSRPDDFARSGARCSPRASRSAPSAWGSATTRT